MLRKYIQWGTVQIPRIYRLYYITFSSNTQNKLPKVPVQLISGLDDPTFDDWWDRRWQSIEIFPGHFLARRQPLEPKVCFKLESLRPALPKIHKWIPNGSRYSTSYEGLPTQRILLEPVHVASSLWSFGSMSEEEASVSSQNHLLDV
jgi:hypothetical protein